MKRRLLLQSNANQRWLVTFFASKRKEPSTRQVRQRADCRRLLWLPSCCIHALDVVLVAVQKTRQRAGTRDNTAKRARCLLRNCYAGSRIASDGETKELLKPCVIFEPIWINAHNTT